MNILSITGQCLVLCKAPLTCNNLLQAPRHGLNQVSEVLGVRHPGNPQLLDLFLQHLNVGTADILQLHLHPGPHILDGIQVRAVAWPVYLQDVGPLPERLPAHPHLACYYRKTAKSIFLYTLPRQKVFVRSP